MRALLATGLKLPPVVALTALPYTMAAVCAILLVTAVLLDSLFILIAAGVSPLIFAVRFGIYLAAGALFGLAYYAAGGWLRKKKNPYRY